MAKYLSESPGVGKRVLDVEVVGVVEDGDDFARRGRRRVSGSITALGRDGDGVERDGRVCDGGHFLRPDAMQMTGLYRLWFWIDHSGK